MKEHLRSIHIFLTASRAAHASDLDILKRKLVIVGQLLATGDQTQCKNHHVFLTHAIVDNLRETVRVTRVVDKPGSVPSDLQKILLSV